MTDPEIDAGLSPRHPAFSRQVAKCRDAAENSSIMPVFAAFSGNTAVFHILDVKEGMRNKARAREREVA